MDEQQPTTQQPTSDTPTVVSEQPPAPPAQPIVIRSEETSAGGFSFGSFLIGFLTAIIAGAIGIGVFLAISDADDDGNLEIDVPAVDLDVDG